MVLGQGRSLKCGGERERKRERKRKKERQRESEKEKERSKRIMCHKVPHFKLGQI